MTEPPKDAFTHHALGNLFAAQNNIDAALEEYEEAAALAPNNISFRIALGLTLVKANNPARATKEFLKVLVIAPDNVLAMKELSRLGFHP